ncbi:MAG: hypothetical protein NVSMB17_13140 [Candidatus Dormibacteria bacterium]
MLTSLASSIAPVALHRDGKGFVRLRVGFDPARPVALGRGRQALITLWLAGVLADGVKQTPIWKAIAVAAPGSSDSVGAGGAFDPRDFSLDTAEIVFTWAAFALFFWAFTVLAAALSQRRATPLAAVVAPSLIPIALAYLLAHNLTQLLVVTPLAWSASGVSEAAMRFQIQDNIRHVMPAVIFFVQVTAIVVGHVVAVLMAHARLRQVEQDPSIAIRADLGWLMAMLVYTATSLWVIAQPIANTD